MLEFLNESVSICNSFQIAKIEFQYYAECFILEIIWGFCWMWNKCENCARKCLQGGLKTPEVRTEWPNCLRAEDQWRLRCHWWFSRCRIWGRGWCVPLSSCPLLSWSLHSSPSYNPHWPSPQGATLSLSGQNPSSENCFGSLSSHTWWNCIGACTFRYTSLEFKTFFSDKVELTSWDL